MFIFSLCPVSFKPSFLVLNPGNVKEKNTKILCLFAMEITIDYQHANNITSMGMPSLI